MCDRQADRQTYRDRQTDWWVDTVCAMDRQTYRDRQTDRQTDC